MLTQPHCISAKLGSSGVTQVPVPSESHVPPLYLWGTRGSSHEVVPGLHLHRGRLLNVSAPAGSRGRLGPPVFLSPEHSGQVWGKGEEGWAAVLAASTVGSLAGLTSLSGEEKWGDCNPGPSHPLYTLCSSALDVKTSQAQACS